MTLNIGLALLEQVGDIAKRAGREIMSIYGQGFTVEQKDDSTPVTEADRASEALIVRSIREGITNEFPIIAEEAFSSGAASAAPGRAFWLVDPLDGTKEFIDRNGEFTVNIALIEVGRPVLGVVHAPAIGTTYWGARNGAFVESGDEPTRQIRCRAVPDAGLVALVSRSHRTADVDAYLADYDVACTISAGSALKFCRIAAGAADVYPRFGRTMEWDTAAGHAVLMYAGGRVVDAEGADIGYGKPGFENPDFIAWGALGDR